MNIPDIILRVVSIMVFAYVVYHLFLEWKLIEGASHFSNRYRVVGKVRDREFPSQYEWVIGDSKGNFIAVGSSTVYRWMNGKSCGTLDDSYFSDLTARAEMREAAGKQYKIYTWKELMGDKQ